MVVNSIQYTYSPAALRVIVSPGGIVGNVLLSEQVYVPLLELVNEVRRPRIPYEWIGYNLFISHMNKS